MSKITVFTARQIHTMNDSAPHATAVAVRDGKILETGTLETLRPWVDAHDYEIDDRFAGKVVMPGFIDPHLHPSLGAVLLPANFTTAFEWSLPGREVAATKGHENYLRAIGKAVEQTPADQELFISWGYHQLWHGDVTRQKLNEISTTRPIVVWHRSFHELIVNDAALSWMKIEPEVMERHPQINPETGRFSELGAMVAIASLKPFLFSLQWFGQGMLEMLKVAHFGGHTTVADMAWGIFDFEQEWQAYSAFFDNPSVPLRTMMVPRGLPEAELTGAPEEAVRKIEALTDRGSEKLFFRKHVKLFTDGAFFSELMQLQEPGYIDGHHGEWLMAPEQFEAVARAYWNEGYRIHVHCTGDLGLELALDTLEKLQWERPRFDHRFTIEHFGASTPEQVTRMARLGALASVNVYYVHELGEAYWQKSIGHERASQMARLGSLSRAGIPFALHSDFTMAPALPLNNAWVAVNRLSESGDVLAPNERISVHDAMKAITINAAYVLGLENEIGSIRAGKRADFTVLDVDPYNVSPEQLNAIDVHATVFEGQVFEVAR